MGHEAAETVEGNETAARGVEDGMRIGTRIGAAPDDVASVVEVEKRGVAGGLRAEVCELGRVFGSVIIKQPPTSGERRGGIGARQQNLAGIIERMWSKPGGAGRARRRPIERCPEESRRLGRRARRRSG